MRMIVRASRERMACVEYINKCLPSAEILFDSTGNAMDTFLRALEIAEDMPCLHMEEDIYVTENFEKKAERAVLEER